MGYFNRYAVVADLNGPMLAMAQRAWQLLSDKFGITYISSRSASPHLSIIAGISEYPESVFIKRMREVSDKLAPFEIVGNGLGIFAREKPVIYIRWLLSAELAQLYKSYERKFRHVIKKFDNSYRPESWLPKTTLAFNDIEYDQLPPILKELLQMNFEQPMRVKSLSFVEYGEHGERIIETIQL